MSAAGSAGGGGENLISRQPEHIESRIAEFFTFKDIEAWRLTSAQSVQFKRTQETLTMGEPYVPIQRNFELLEHYNLSAVKRVEAVSSSMSSELLKTICEGTKGNLISLDLTLSRDDMMRESTSWITNEVLKSIATLCPKLKTLLIGQSCGNITDAGVITLAQGCRQLTSLNLSHCHKLTDAGVIALAQGCRQLSALNLYACDRITDAGVIALAQGCRQLSSLNLYYCGQITDATLRALAVGCPQLSSLDLKYCYQITDVAVIALAQGCPQLSSLNLSWCKQITDASVIALAQECAQLSSLNLKWCDKITKAGVIALARGCPRLSSQNLTLSQNFEEEWRRDFERARVFFANNRASKNLNGGSGGSSGGAASQLASPSAPPRRMRLSYRARF